MRSYSYFLLYLSRVHTIAVFDDARSVGRSVTLAPPIGAPAHLHSARWRVAAVRQAAVTEDFETLLYCRFVLTAALRVLPACRYNTATTLTVAANEAKETSYICFRT